MHCGTARQKCAPRRKNKETGFARYIPPASSGNMQEVTHALQHASSVVGNHHDLQETVLGITLELITLIDSVENHTCGEYRDQCVAVATSLLRKKDISRAPSFCWPSRVETSADFEWGSAVEMAVFRPSNVMGGARGIGEDARKGIWRMGDRWPFWRCAYRYATGKPKQKCLVARRFYRLLINCFRVYV